MRRKKEAVLCFESNDDGLPKVVRDYRERYRAISQVLDDNPKILSAVHRDILKLSEGDFQGRKGDDTSENILRALIVQHIEGLPFRDAVIRIGSDPFLQDFLRMRKRPVMDFTFLDKVLAHWQAFRTGIEGTVSGLKRAFRLIRCFFRGFRSFSAAVGLGVFCHNLIVLAEQEPD